MDQRCNCAEREAVGVNQQAINEAISAWFDLLPCRCEKNENGYSVFQYDSETGKCNFCGGSPTADYFQSENGNARLLEAMRKTKLVVVILGHELNYCAVVWIPAIAAPFSVAEFIDYPSYFKHAERVMAKERKTAVVLAFLKFAGIEAAK